VLDHLGMLGVSWRQGGSQALADFALSEAETNQALARFRSGQGLTELAYISTCNRVELIYCVPPGRQVQDLRPAAFELLTGRRPAPGEAQRQLKAWQGEGAAEHLFLIAAGLDSACVGETEIVGQVRASLERARALSMSGQNLELIYEESLRLAARVRGETSLGQGRVSLAEIAVERLRRRLERTPGLTALIGVSPMTARAAQSLAAARLPFVVVNRSEAAAAELAGGYGAEHWSLDAFRRQPPALEALLSATGAPAMIIDKAGLERLGAGSRSGQAPLIVDLAVPPDFDAALCAELDIPYVGMGEIVAEAEQNRAHRLVQAAEAREQVDAALDELKERLAERYYGPLLGALQRRYRHTAEEGVRRLLDKELKGLGATEKQAIETWAEVLARRFAHIPCLGLRGLLNTGPEGSIDAFLSQLEPEFADELKAALVPDAARQ
jgi:glutamyl-tRNA reductase